MAAARRPGRAWTWRRILVVGAGLAAALWALHVFRDVFVLMALALVIAASLAPLSDGLERRGLPHAAAVTVAMGAMLAAIAAAAAYVVPQIAGQASRLAQDLPQLADRLVALEEQWVGGALGLDAREVMAWLAGRGERLAAHASEGAIMIAKTTVGLLATLFVGYYFLLDRHGLADQVAARARATWGTRSSSRWAATWSRGSPSWRWWAWRPASACGPSACPTRWCWA